MRPDAAGKVIGEKRFLGRFSRKTAMTAIIILLVVAGGLISWNIYLQQSKKVEPVSIEKMAFPLPEKPSIAVLPFDNLSGDSEQDYIADGISENIINALSYIPQMFVIARNSAFYYKGKPVRVQQVSEELGVRYVLEGSVLKSEDKVRVTAQLIDALTGGHIWSEHFDRELNDLFELLDDITMKILTELHVKLAADESVRIYGKGTENLQAYLKLLEGDQHRFLDNKADNEVAKRLYQEALAIDPNYAAAYTSLASALTLDVWLGASKAPKETLLKAMKTAQKAIDLDKSAALAHGQLGSILLILRQHDKAIAQGEKALALAPNNSHLLFLLGASLNLSGRAEEAYPLLQRATRMNPLYPIYYNQLGISCGLTGRYEKGITAVKKALHLAPDDMFAYRVLVFLHISSGRENDALAAANEALHRDPNYSFVKGLKRAPWKDQAFVNRFTELYQKAGLP
jgi:adenylate cyclase